MAYTQSGIERRRNISEMAQALSGAKQRTAELIAGKREGSKNRLFGLLGKGIDFAGGMARQKLVGEQGMEQQKLVGQQRIGEIEATEEEARITSAASQKGKAEVDRLIAEREAELAALATDPDSKYYQRGDVETNMLLLQKVKELSPEDTELFFRLIKTGTITAEDGSETLDSQMLFNAWFIAYGNNARRLGQEPTREGFKAWVENAIQPMAGFDSMSAIQAKSIMDAFPRYAEMLFDVEKVTDVDEGKKREPFLGGAEWGGAGVIEKRKEEFFSQHEKKMEKDLLQKIMEAKKAQTANARGMSEAASIEQQWQAAIDKINEPGYSSKDMARIRRMVDKILRPEKSTPDWKLEPRR